MEKNENSYELYKQARDAAWRTLTFAGIKTLPVDIHIILKALDIPVILYSDYAKFHDASRLNFVSDDGFTKLIDGKKVIFLNDTIATYERRRFTICHEIGHIILNHPITDTLARNSETDTNNPLETQANIVSRNLLMPACVLHDLNIVTPEQIRRACNISITSAAIRSERLRQLKIRKMFYTSPLEQQVREQFNQFIKNWKKREQYYDYMKTALAACGDSDLPYHFVCPKCKQWAEASVSEDGLLNVFCETCRFGMSIYICFL